MARLERLDNRRLAGFLRRIERAVAGAPVPVVSLIAQGSRDPFRVLVSTLLSARTKDETTAAAAERLFAVASTPAELEALPESRIAELVFPVGFYKTKARHLRRACRQLLDEFGGEVPRTIDELTRLPGVGRKTANLVLVEGFRIPALCVDTHVHRITNLWGYVDTASPAETEMALRRVLPKRYWLDFNRLLVSFGQTICAPVSPWCSRCPLEASCPRLGVARSR